MKKITVSKAQEGIKKYYNNLLSRHLTMREFNSIDFHNVSFYNNKNFTIRAVGCPHLYKEGGVVYIFKSSKEDLDNYTLVKEIKSLDIGKFGYNIDMLLDSKLKYKNILIVTSLSNSNNSLCTYVYGNIFGKYQNLTIIRNDNTIDEINDIKLTLLKVEDSLLSLFVLTKGTNKGNDDIVKSWERFLINVEWYKITHKLKE